jgi:hypothetical protein
VENWKIFQASDDASLFERQGGDNPVDIGWKSRGIGSYPHVIPRGFPGFSTEKAISE